MKRHSTALTARRKPGRQPELGLAAGSLAEVFGSPEEIARAIRATSVASVKTVRQASRARSQKRKRHGRPAAPYAQFPLQAHASGYWCKRVRGKLHYFGRWSERKNGKLTVLPDGGNWKAALQKFNEEIHELQAGRRPRKDHDSDGLRLNELCNRFLTCKLRRVESGELTQRTFKQYRDATDMTVEVFGSSRLASDLTAEDFEALRARITHQYKSPISVGKFVQMVRSTFKYGVDAGLISSAVLFGEFKRPSKKVLRRHKATRDKRLFTVDEVRLILSALNGEPAYIATKAGITKRITFRKNLPLRAMVLLALNAACGNSDVSALNWKQLDLGAGLFLMPRTKTGVGRRVPLWQETIDALNAAISVRVDPKNHQDDDAVFLNRNGRRLVQTTDASNHDGVGVQFGHVLRRLHINGRQGLNFYALRHTAATIALQTADRSAVRSIMGHIETDVLDFYDELGVSDERLQNVVEHVRKWVFCPMEI